MVAAPASPSNAMKPRLMWWLAAAAAALVITVSLYGR
jgi:predicted cobalt transporter CbtA